MLFIYLLIFIILFTVSFYPFGLFVVEKVDAEFYAWEKIILSLLFSSVSFVVIAMLLGLLNLRFLMLPLIIIVNGYALIKLQNRILDPWRGVFGDKKLILLILIAIIVQGVINFPSGYLFKDSLMFWSSQGNDGLWHVSLMEEAKKSMPLMNPIYYGERLFNYHYLSDVLMGEFGRIYPFFTSLDLYFRFFPIVLSVFISMSVFSFMYRWKFSKTAGYWGIFFTSLSGGFGYIVYYIKNKQIFGGETTFWAAQGNTIIGNPPHAMAYALLPSTFLLMLIYLKKRDIKYLFLSLLLGGFIVGFKVSAGFIASVGIGVAALVDSLVNKKKSLFFYALTFGLLNISILKLLSKGAVTFLVWQPWWFVRTTITAPGRVEWMDLELRRQYYASLNTFRGNLRVVQFEIEAFLIYVIGNLGSRFLAFLIIFQDGANKILDFFKDTANLMLLGSMLSGLIITLLFVQKGIAYNLIQFMQYFILIFGFFMAAFVDTLLLKIKSKFFRFLIISLLIIISIPTVVGNLVEFYGPGKTPLANISVNEVDALKYLRNNTKTDSVILTYPFDSNSHWKYRAQPRPISAWYDTAYVSAISSRRTFLSNNGQVDILGIDYNERLAQIVKYFDGKDAYFDNNFTKGNNISYIYIYKPLLKTPLNEHLLNVVKMYENSEVIIYKTL